MWAQSEGRVSQHKRLPHFYAQKNRDSCYRSRTGEREVEEGQNEEHWDPPLGPRNDPELGCS